MRNTRIELKSHLLQEHFCSDSVPFDLFMNNYKSYNNVLDNPEKFPNADFEHLVSVVEEMMLEAPIEISKWRS